MKAILNTFKSGNGDCIFLRLKNSEFTFTIMIDCGRYTDEIKNFVESILEKKINMLIVTHIDNDHIDGLITMFKTHVDLSVDKILYNCYQCMNGQQVQAMSDTVKKDIDKLKSNLPPRIDKSKEKINMVQASTLAEILLSNDNWKHAWFKDSYITVETLDMFLGEGFGKLLFLSPRKEDIFKLDKQFAKEYMRLTHHATDNNHFDGKETLYELVSKLVSMTKKSKELINNKKIAHAHINCSEKKLEEAYHFSPSSISDENTASIAFIWEFGNYRILFMGDAEPVVVEKSLKQKMGDQEISYKAIKISHHGSKHSTNIALMKLIDSNHYFITGGNVSDKPSIEALAKIIKKNGGHIRFFHYNNERNKLMQYLATDDATSLCRRYNFQITPDNEFEFEY